MRVSEEFINARKRFREVSQSLTDELEGARFDLWYSATTEVRKAYGMAKAARKMYLEEKKRNDRASDLVKALMYENNELKQGVVLSDEDIKTNLRLVKVLDNCHSIDVPSALLQLEEGLMLMLDMVQRYHEHNIPDETLGRLLKEVALETSQNNT